MKNTKTPPRPFRTWQEYKEKQKSLRPKFTEFSFPPGTKFIAGGAMDKNLVTDVLVAKSINCFFGGDICIEYETGPDDPFAAYMNIGCITEIVERGPGKIVYGKDKVIMANFLRDKSMRLSTSVLLDARLLGDATRFLERKGYLRPFDKVSMYEIHRILQRLNIEKRLRRSYLSTGHEDVLVIPKSLKRKFYKTVLQNVSKIVTTHKTNRPELFWDPEELDDEGFISDGEVDLDESFPPPTEEDYGDRLASQSYFEELSNEIDAQLDQKGAWHGFK